VAPIYMAGVGAKRLEAQSPSPAADVVGGEPEAAADDYFEANGESIVEKSGPWTLADIMTSPVLTASCHQSVRELVELLAGKGIAGVPVVDGENRLVGVISQSDIAAHVARSWAEVPAEAAPFYQSLWITAPDTHERLSAETSVDKLMAPYVFYATPDSTLEEAADLMLAHGIHRVIVLRGQEIAGIVTSLDLLRAFRQAR